MKDRSQYSSLHLTHAPIVQAILEIQFLKDSNKSLNLDKLHDQFKDQYPQKKKRFKGTLTFDQRTSETMQTQTEEDGYTFISEDGLKSIIAAPNQFNFMQSGQYSTWEDFIIDAKKIWNQYLSLTSVRQISRLSVRYINKINIALPIVDIAEHFKTYLMISPSLNQTLENFYLRYTIPLKEEDVLVHVVHTIGEVEKNLCPFYFDIDALWFPKEDFNFKNIWKEFENLRLIKNETFLESLTEKTIDNLK